MDETKSSFAAVTHKTKAKALKTIARDVATLNIPKPATPKRLGKEHILGLLAVWKSRGLALSSQHKLLADLEGFLTWMGNPVIAKMRREPGGRRVFPGNKPKPIQTLTEEELDRMRSVAASMDGWHGSVARFLIGTLPYTGLRPKEVRLAKLADVDLTKGLILVSAPKGDGSWAAPDFARIPPVARQAFADFLAERTEYLAGEACEWLIPLRGLHGAQDQEPTLGSASEDWLRHLKCEVQRGSGVRFRGWKTMRATFAQAAIDGGAPIESVSKAMRHASTLTTEKYYGRIRNERTYADIDRAFERPIKVAPR